MSGIQKAAIVLGVLVAEGVDLPLSGLPADMQAMLAQTMTQMRLIDRATMNAVVAEYVDMLEQVGLSFPDGIDGAIALLDGRLDDAATRQLRAISGPAGHVDPWGRLETAEDAELLALLQAESIVVGAVMLARLSVERAAKLLTLMPQEQAQDLAMTVARTEDIAPDAVVRIGAALAAQLGTRAPRAFAVPPPKRVGDLLNLSPPALRDSLLAGLESRDMDFARNVRKAIFTFQDIPQRLSQRDVGGLMREMDSADLLTLLCLDDPADRPALAFLLENMSKRLADGLREDASTLPAPAASARDAAMARITGAIRRLADSGVMTLRGDG